MPPRDAPPSRQLPLWLKIFATAYVAVLVPAYWYHYGFADSFLWFSSLALFIATAALWLESPRLASMQLVSVFLLELMWIVDYVGRVFFDVQLIGIAGYMFDGQKPLYVRGLSLFHAALPLLLVWLVYRLGYDRRAWIVQTIFAWLRTSTGSSAPAKSRKRWSRRWCTWRRKWPCCPCASIGRRTSF